MRLLQIRQGGDIRSTLFLSDDIPQYAILSHTWGADEVTFQDLQTQHAKDKLGYNKIDFCGRQARKNGLDYFWVDTCCIDKTSSSELQESINCMFRWYQGAARCYVYLADVSSPGAYPSNEFASWEVALRNSKWFTRGWTLQELIAPCSVEFFSRDGQILGDRTSLEHIIYDTTKIPIRALRGTPLSTFSVSDRMQWMERRMTTRKEDKAYALLGIFEVQIPLLYGEGEDKAFKRLLEEIHKS
ncbi:hypothetical protein GQ53DRAFT_625629, partial [Thozetella sp. PMI_491]